MAAPTEIYDAKINIELFLKAFLKQDKYTYQSIKSWNLIFKGSFGLIMSKISSLISQNLTGSGVFLIM